MADKSAVPDEPGARPVEIVLQWANKRRICYLGLCTADEEIMAGKPILGYSDA
jgi:hypothetical protein